MDETGGKQALLKNGLDPSVGKATQFKPGESGNPNGKPKGRRNLATIVRDVLEEELDWSLMDPKDAKKLAAKYDKKVGWEAVIHVQTAKALDGDTKAAEFLRTAGYGNKLDVTTGGERLGLFGSDRLRVEIVDPKDDGNGNDQAEPDASDGVATAE